MPPTSLGGGYRLCLAGGVHICYNKSLTKSNKCVILSSIIIVIFCNESGEFFLKIECNTSAIGVFDSGMGGISVLRDIVKLMPNERYIYYGDSANAPYGIKRKEEIIELSIKVCDFLVSKGVKAIVVACNTATSAAVKILRDRYLIPIIGMEPAVKPALNIAKGKNIVVLATPITLKETKFKSLLNRLNAEKRVLKIPAPKLVELVESGDIDCTITKKIVKDYIKNVDMSEVGAIVLGCTHFVFLKEILKEVIDYDIPIIDGNRGTATHLKNLLELQQMLTTQILETSYIEYYNSSKDLSMIELSKKLYSM